MQIVDAQIHTWGQGLPSNQSHWPVTHFTPAEAIRLMDEGDVDAAVIHPPGWDPNLERRRCRRSGTIPAAWRSWVPMTSSRQTPEWELR